MEREELKEIIHEVLDQRNRVDAEMHAADHAFIALMRQREKRKQEIWISVRKNVIGFLVISLLTALGALIINGWNAVNHRQPPSIGGAP